MKRLITIFLTFFIGIIAWAQVPMTIVGDVYIANGDGGVMLSQGTVHIQAPSLDKAGRVSNYGKLEMDSVILYSNELLDGLLLNGNTTPNAVTANVVVVRKNFPENKWYMMSIPFDVDLTKLKNSLDGTTLVRNTHFDFKFYDSQRRADVGLNVDDNWVKSPPDSKMKKGIAYRFAVDPGSGTRDATGAYADFITDSSDDIKHLFSTEVKGVDLTYAKSTTSTHYGNSEGWNAIGGLNSTNYLLNYHVDNRTTQWGNAIYYRDFDDMVWKQFFPDDPDVKGMLRPYAIMFVKTSDYLANLTEGGLIFNKDANPARGYGGFTYLNGGKGITLEKSSEVDFVFRSMPSSSYDLICLTLTDAKNTSSSSLTYFRLKNDYSKLFKEPEDNIVIDTDSKRTQIIWSLAKYENMDGYNQLFVNSLPYGEHEIPLGVNIPAAGEYIFSLKERLINEPLKSAFLLDKNTNEKVDLLKNDYHFKADSYFNTEDRFVLFLSNSITSIDPLQKGPVFYAYTENNILTVKYVNPGDKVQVLDLTGRVVASGIATGNTFSATLNQKGVYIVNVKGQTTIKVLNK